MNELGKIFLGVLLLTGCHILILTILGAIASAATGNYNIGIIYLYALLGIGIAQLIYVIPLIIWLRWKRKWGIMKGVIIGAVITALLNGGCWLLLSNFYR
ncbi:MAG TPA: hypothetical protein DEG17_00930 [Cyanobacteria bacterium UBA11149]|nr:hypothetical protein [Cyanobacteria bacterium UBA11367]HBE59095.1 hypothetical protein [Cyanobacteria bacterium UBA11366]HBK64119.1 hypothetical protein [Cyanobacteria bacterium UBA11166]HBR72775.1 hypothetical protein [Cyanobacteria bacterium UBA11159]HBS67953.1 hypothetical protein [Cyanobacteria bacterium UBA11153]HBW87477.1 hypothetical protein [Cyanobacteria bacterium UBA11149]HCA94061.1 hypothetical protein [Cyanobacteria bacterium UBA9226]